MRKLVALAVLIVTLGACATVAERENPEPEKLEVVLAPGKTYEECYPADPPRVMDYWFSSSAPIEFNIHYHGDVVVYPVRSEAAIEWRGVFDLVSIRDYNLEKPPFFCLMWTNPHSEDVQLAIDVDFREKELLLSSR